MERNLAVEVTLRGMEVVQAVAALVLVDTQRVLVVGLGMVGLLLHHLVGILSMVLVAVAKAVLVPARRSLESTQHV